MTMIAASLLSADFSVLAQEMQAVKEARADMLHLDIMDGHFVPNLTFGPPVIKMLRPHSDLIFDVHLMVTRPELYIEPLAAAGVEMISFHYETMGHIDRLVQQIKAHKIKAGVVLNPATPVEVLYDILGTLDYVLLMSVNPGFGGQTFIPYVTHKVLRLKRLIEEQQAKTLIEIDGGVTPENAAELRAAGADILVAGSAIFNSRDRFATIQKLKGK